MIPFWVLYTTLLSLYAFYPAKYLPLLLFRILVCMYIDVCVCVCSQSLSYLWGYDFTRAMQELIYFLSNWSCMLSHSVVSMDCIPPGSSVHGLSQQGYPSGLPFPPPQQLIRLSELELAEHQSSHLSADIFSCFSGLLSPLGAESRLPGYDVSLK